MVFQLIVIIIIQIQSIVFLNNVRSKWNIWNGPLWSTGSSAALQQCYTMLFALNFMEHNEFGLVISWEKVWLSAKMVFFYSNSMIKSAKY
jgi:hypothetical protein